MKLGLIEFRDFTFHEIFNKKICMVNANCHGPYVVSYLKQCASFSERYGFHPFNAMAVKGSDIVPDENLLSHIDVLIYQPMKKTNVFGEKFSDEYILSKIKPNCITICMPNFYGLGRCIYPYQTWTLYESEDGGKFYQDNLLEEAFDAAEEKDIHHILDYINKKKVDIEKYEEIHKNTFLELHQRDLGWNIKMESYIIDNYKKIPMFNDIGHPSKYLMLVTCKKICEYLGLKDTEENVKNRDANFLKEYNLGAYGIVYNQIKDKLGIVYDTNSLEVSKKTVDVNKEGNKEKSQSREVSIEEFIREYFYVSRKIMLD